MKLKCNRTEAQKHLIDIQDFRATDSDDVFLTSTVKIIKSSAAYENSIKKYNIIKIGLNK